MRPNHAIRFTPLTDSGEIEVCAYAKDTAGNEPWMIFNVNRELSVSFNLQQAKWLVRQLGDAIVEMEKIGRS